MGKSSKKSATKVDAAPAVVASPTKPVKKGKREPEEAVVKQVATKKQKKNDGTALKQAIVKQKTETKTQKKSKKKEESSSSDEESEEETKPAAKKPVKQPSDSSSGEDSSSSDEDVTEKPAALAKNGTVGNPVTKGKPAGSSDDSDSESEGEESEDDEPKKASAKNVHAPAVAKNGSVAAKKKDESSDDSADGSSSDEDSDEDEAPAPKGPRSKKPTPTTAAKQKVDTEEADSEEENSSESESSDEESSEGEEKVSKTPKKKDADVEMVDADSAKTKKASQTPQTPQAQATGSKTLFMGNLSFSIEKTDVEDFFKDAGEIADVRFATDRDGAFKGFGHVEFATVEAAQKALELHGQELLGRQIKLDLARERGAYTPSNGNANSYQKGGRAQGQSIFVRGFDANDGEEKIRSTLEEYFGSCGTISRVSIPTDYESGAVKGIAYMDFSDSDGVNKALALDGSEIAKGSFLTVQEAKPRGDSFGSGGRSGGDRSGGRFGRGGGRGFGGRSGGRGGRFSGGDSGGFGGRHGDRGGRGGRGGPNRSSMTAAGKKTTFDD